MPVGHTWYPLKVEPSFRERIWGPTDLSHFYPARPAARQPIGEVWLTADDNAVINGHCAGQTLAQVCGSLGLAFAGQTIHRPSAAAAFPLLVKFIFTADKLSVQVHPPDDYALQAEGCSGKTEMWHVLKAEPGARLAIGFREEGTRPDRATLIEAVRSGAIEDMLNWTEAQEGDTFFVPAGTVHAIGAGLVICEIQQNCDLTYRLYDYNRLGADGRLRELHVEKALEVMRWRTCGGRTSPLGYAVEEGSRQCLAACPYFATEKIVLQREARFETEGQSHIWMGIEGEAEVELNGHRCALRRGEAVIVPAGAGPYALHPVASSVLLRSYEPDLERDVLGPLRARGYTEQELSRVCFPGRPTHVAEWA